MWSADDVARDLVRREGNGLNAAEVDVRIAEAATWTQEIGVEWPAEYKLGDAADAEWLAEVRMAKLAEWQRVRNLMIASGWDTYKPEQDVQGSDWAREREERRQGAVGARSASEARQVEEADELRVEVCLPAGPGHLVRTAADRAGLRPAEVLAQLAERVVLDEDGTVAVPPFRPAPRIPAKVRK